MYRAGARDPRTCGGVAGWNNGFLSCAHWLHSTPTRTHHARRGPRHWRTSIDLGACREKVRVAKALATLPLTSATMQRGAISYAKVRAVTREATPGNDGRLVDLALAGTASQVERFVRAWRRVDRAEAATQTNARHLGRHLSTWVDDDGMVVIRGRLTPEIGAVVQRALEAAADHLFREASGAPAGPTLCEEVTAGQRRADALGLLAEAALTADLDRGSSGDRYQVILHVDADEPRAAHLAPVAETNPFDGVLETDFGATYVPPKRHGGSPAMRQSSRCATTRQGRCSTWGGSPARCRRQSAVRSLRATAVVASLAARRGGATPIM